MGYAIETHTKTKPLPTTPPSSVFGFAVGTVHWREKVEGRHPNSGSEHHLGPGRVQRDTKLRQRRDSRGWVDTSEVQV